MKPNQMLASFVVASLVLAASAFASTDASTAKYLEHYKVLRTDIPLPVKVVSPTGLPLSYKDKTVTVTMLIDREGQPQNVVIASPANPELSRLLVPVISQWRFSPARQDGVPVARQVKLPLHLS
jgi:TonB family protein